MAEKGLKKNLSWNTIGMILYNLAVWLFSAMILRILDAEASGIYAVASSVGNTLYAAALWGMRGFIVSDTADEYPLSSYFSARVLAVILASAALIPVIALSGYSAVQNSVLIAYTLFKAAEAMIELTDCFCQKQFRMEISAGSMILRSLLYVPAFFISLYFFRSMTAGFAVLTVLSLTVFFTVNLRRTRSLKMFETSLIPDRNAAVILRRCFPIMAFELLASLIVAIPRLFYERIGSLSSLGIYTSIYTLVIFLQLVINILIFTLAPYMASSYHEGKMKEFRQYLLMLTGGAFGLGLAAEIMTFLLGRPVISLIYGEAAGPYYTYLYLGIVSGVSLACTWIVSQLLVIVSHERDQLYCSLISTVSCVLLSRLLVIPEQCGRMSVVLILTNIIFIVSAYLLSFRYRKAGSLPGRGE